MIKWENVKIGVSPLTNEIYIGKTKKTKLGEEWTDKSGPMTEDFIRAVMTYMLNNYDRYKKKSLKCGKTKLTIEVEGDEDE